MTRPHKDPLRSCYGSRLTSQVRPRVEPYLCMWAPPAIKSLKLIGRLTGSIGAVKVCNYLFCCSTGSDVEAGCGGGCRCFRDRVLNSMPIIDWLWKLCSHAEIGGVRSKLESSGPDGLGRLRPRPPGPGRWSQSGVNWCVLRKLGRWWEVFQNFWNWVYQFGENKSIAAKSVQIVKRLM